MSPERKQILIAVAAFVIVLIAMALLMRGVNSSDMTFH